MVVLVCEKEIAFDSPDSIEPWGTRRDNSRNPQFNTKLYWLFGAADGFKKQLSFLDLGCSDGGFVKDCIDSWHIAVGLEGSDWSKKHQRACWPVISRSLFTCDITRNFDIYEDEKKSKRASFNAVTAWEVMEHIKEEDIAAVAKNVSKHLRKDGLWILSVANCEEVINGVRLHQTVGPKKWWVEKFSSLGIVHMEGYLKFFNSQYLRGRHETETGFHLVLSPSPKDAPQIPKEPLIYNLADLWFGSKPQMLLKKAVTGEW